MSRSVRISKHVSHGPFDKSEKTVGSHDQTLLKVLL